MLLLNPCLICAAANGPVCVACRTQLVPGGAFASPGIDRCRAAFTLDENLLLVIAALKYRGERRVAHWIATQMVPFMPRAADLITWVPTTVSRRRTSGYDHGREIARAVSRLTNVPARPLLRRASDRRQTGRSRAERHVGPDLRAVAACPEFVVVIDDVVTTGSSLRVAADELRSRCAARVVGLAAARTPSRPLRAW